MTGTKDAVAAFRERAVAELKKCREECRAKADARHAARNYALEAEYRHWFHAMSEAIYLVETL